MVKTGVFKKIAALTAAVAMMASFALCASAAKVETTTQYTDSTKQEINVIANVSELDGPVEVTYYATNNGTVYIDQKTANDDGTVSFDYVTGAANLLTSSVSVGYTDAPAALPDDVPGYTISGDGITAINVPTEDINGTHVLAYNLASGKNFVGVESDDATVSSANYADGTLTVVLAEADSDVTLTVVTETQITHYPEAEFVDAALIVSDGSQDKVDEDKDVHAGEGDRKLSVLAKVIDAEVFGILVSTEEITDETVAADAFAAQYGDVSYQALGANENTGYFAVQLIDTGDDNTAETWINSEAAYYTAVYYQHPDTLEYHIILGGTVQVEAN